MTLKVNSKELERFWYFVEQRQLIWHRRFVQKLPQSKWTKNKYLKQYKFTNVFRHLDRGSIWTIQMLAMPHLKFMKKKINYKNDYPSSIFYNIIETMWKMGVYRLINKIETFEELGIPEFRGWFKEKKVYEYNMEKLAEKQSVFTSAYITCQCSFKQSRIKNFFMIATAYHDDLLSICEFIETNSSIEQVTRRLAKVWGIGMFTAFQIALDFTYAGIISDGRDEWADAGPGARRGLQLIFPDITRNEYQDGMKFLRDNQKIDISIFPPSYDHIMLSDIENCLCEFSKYWKLRRGEGKKRMIFRETTKVA